MYSCIEALSKILKFMAFSIHDVCVNVSQYIIIYMYVCTVQYKSVQMCAFMQCLIVCAVAWIVCTPVVQYVQCSITHCTFCSVACKIETHTCGCKSGIY